MKLPFVFLNLAMTADGKIATANRASSSFSSKRDKEHMMELRATADAVMSGARTVDLNPVTLGPGAAKYRELRLKRGLPEYNVRVIASRLGTIDPAAKIFETAYSPIIILTTERADQRRLERLRKLGAHVHVGAFGKSDLDFHSAFAWLRDEWKVKRLLCEGGGEVDDALFRANLVDELHLTICPKIFGGRSAPTISDGVGSRTLAQATQLRLHSMQRQGDEMFLVYRRAPRKRSARSGVILQQ
jgi:2,5-diamino-6-(ribosylamino)-4(3H)-pyrimidinone 5'-phosphate reductase